MERKDRHALMVRLSDQEFERLQEICRWHYRSLNGEVRAMIQESWVKLQTEKDESPRAE